MPLQARIFYVDNLRVFLTGLVLLHHFAITYGAPGGWYFEESEAGFPEIIPFSMFVATNQAFFMGMFFFHFGLLSSSISPKKRGSKIFKRPVGSSSRSLKESGTPVSHTRRPLGRSIKFKYLSFYCS